MASMTVTAPDRTPVPDVVACLLPHLDPHTVARAAVREAVQRSARVRFLCGSVGRSTRSGASPPDDRATFVAALRALREFPPVHVTFERVEGQGRAVVERSRSAVVVVVVADVEAGPDSIAAYCQRFARCDVLTVRARAPRATA